MWDSKEGECRCFVAMTSRLCGEHIEHFPRNILGADVSDGEYSQDVYTPLPRRMTGPTAPLSFAQERIWQLNQLNPDCHLNRQVGIRLRGELCIQALERAFSLLLERHEVLRARFSVGDIGLQQSISRDCLVELPLVDLVDWPKIQRETLASRLAAQEQVQQFDLESGPILRAKLLKLHEYEHILVITTHQIVSDMQSEALLVEDLLHFYEGRQLPALPIQYADFAAWQREQVDGRLFDRELRYWRDRLKNAPLLVEVPPDRQRLQMRDLRTERVPIAVSRELTAELCITSRQEGCTLFVTLLAALKTLVHRYTESDEVVIGVSAANRHYSEVEGCIGCFANILTVRTPTVGGSTFRELLLRVRAMVKEAFAHANLPVEMLVEELRGACDISFAPLCQIFFEFDDSAAPEWHAEGLSATRFELDYGASPHDLTLHLEAVGSELKGWLEYAVDLFDRVTIEHLVEHYTILLEGIVRNPSQPLPLLPIVSAAERAWQRMHFDRTTWMLPPGACVHELIREQCVSTPEGVAVECGGQTLSFAELDFRSERLAELLSSLDIGPNDLVAVCVDRSLEVIVALLGILKAGAAYLPIDPSLSEEQLFQIVRDAQPSALLTCLEATQNLSLSRREGQEFGCGIECPIIYLDNEVWDEMGYKNSRRPRSCPGPDDLACVISTSDFTAHLKGIQVPHRALANIVESTHERLGVSRRDTLLAVTGIARDIAGLDLLLPLAIGAKLVIATDADLSDGVRLAHLVESVQPTLMYACPLTWRMLLEAGWKGNRTLKILCDYKGLTGELIDQLRQCCGSLWSTYGLPETGIWSAISRVEPEEPLRISDPVSNTSFHVLDRFGQPVPVGVPGELFIGGDGVALGYRGQPEWTAQCFIPDPFRPNATGRLFRTGDRVRYKRDGGIERLGRMGRPVDVRGFRLGPEEIEMALRSHPGVAQAVVTMSGDLPSGQRSVAYIEPAVGHTVTSGELQKFLRHTIPECMLPSAIVTMALFPSASGREPDCNLLSKPDYFPVTSGEIPHTELERLIRKVWQEMLTTIRIGFHDDFLDIGGNSLLAEWVRKRLSDAIGRDFPLNCISQNTTISRLSDFLASAKPAGTVLLTTEQPRKLQYDLKGKESLQGCERAGDEQRCANGVAAASLCP